MEILVAFLAGSALAGVLFWLKNKNTATQLFDAQKALGRTEEIVRANDELKTKNDALTTRLQEVQQENSRLAERERSLEKAEQERKQFMDNVWQEQEKRFNAMQEKSEQSYKTYQAQSQAFFKQITSQSIKEQKEELVQKTDEIYTPLKEKLDEFSKQMGDLRTESTSRHSALEKTLERTMQLNENLSKEAQNLTNALTNNNKIQGNWGEIILEDVLTAAGLHEGVEFEKQVPLHDEENKLLKPDFIIHLPNKRDLVIDSKMSLNAYNKWVNEPEGPQKQQYLKEHIQSVEQHIKELSDKDYPKLLKNEKLDFTFMFIPIEYAYFAALLGNPELNEFAHKKHIVITTASNLFGLMQLVENLWRIETSTQTINKIFKTAQEMHTRVTRFVTRMDFLHKKMVDLEKAYKDANTTLLGQRGIIKSAKDLEELIGVPPAQQLPEPAEEIHLLSQQEEPAPEPVEGDVLPQEDNASSGAQ